MAEPTIWWEFVGWRVLRDGEQFDIAPTEARAREMVTVFAEEKTAHQWEVRPLFKRPVSPVEGTACENCGGDRMARHESGAVWSDRPCPLCAAPVEGTDDGRATLPAEGPLRDELVRLMIAKTLSETSTEDALVSAYDVLREAIGSPSAGPVVRSDDVAKVLDELSLHDDTGDEHDRGYMAAINDVRERLTPSVGSDDVQDEEHLAAVLLTELRPRLTPERAREIARRQLAVQASHRRTTVGSDDEPAAWLIEIPPVGAAPGSAWIARHVALVARKRDELLADFPNATVIPLYPRPAPVGQTVTGHDAGAAEALEAAATVDELSEALDVSAALGRLGAAGWALTRFPALAAAPASTPAVTDAVQHVSVPWTGDLAYELRHAASYLSGRSPSSWRLLRELADAVAAAAPATTPEEGR